MMRFPCSVLVAIATLTGTASADIINVPGDFPTIQAAILAALEGDEIIVAPGVYNEAIFFNGKNITLRSSGGPDVTTIDATRLNNHAVRCILGEGPSTLLKGFTITGGYRTGGAGMRIERSAPTIIDCVIINNTAPEFGVAGGMLNFDSDATIINCEFINNTAFNFGGGMSNVRGSNVTLINCNFIDNTLGGGGGGGLHNQSGLTMLINCIFSGNSQGSGIAGNAIDNGSAGRTTLINSIVWGNGLDPINGTANTVIVQYSDIEGGWPGSRFSILADPMFVDPENGDYRLSPGSPCIDLGNNAAIPAGIGTDLDGNPRFVDDPKTPDCPQPGADCGDRPIVDMGAYEFQISACPWDLGRTGAVGILDLLALLAAWGTDPGGPPDFDGDGTVGILDLLALLANWGPCP